jgi:hypothetical protein
MKVTNTLNETVKTMVCGIPYTFLPKEEKPIYNMNHFNMFRKKSHLGLATLFYDNNQMSRYESYEDYEFAIKKKSLEDLLKEVKGHLLNEKQAAKEIKADKNASVFDSESVNVEKFENRVKEVEGELKNLVKSKTKKVA